MSHALQIHDKLASYRIGVTTGTYKHMCTCSVQPANKKQCCIAARKSASTSQDFAINFSGLLSHEGAEASALTCTAIASRICRTYPQARS